jgi:glycosyltransferase involved in cell wall biosynthesis
MRIKGVTRQGEGGGYYRIHQPLDELARHGHETVCVPAKSDVTADGADVLVGQMIGGVNRWWRRLARYTRLVYELDDDPFEIERINPSYEVYSDPLVMDSLAHCVEVADLVTVTTELLAERMRKHNPNVVAIENRIDEFMLAMERPRRDKLVIGWAGGGSHGNDVASCVYGLRRALDLNPQVEAHFIGADYRWLVKRPVRHTEWCQKTVDYYKLIDFDIGIIPLVETRFAVVKSHSKALEYAALGIPVIASDVAPYREFVVDGVTGFLIRREHEWLGRLRDLISDEAMREQMGAKARELAAQWTIQKGWKEWETAYASIL